MPNNSKDADDYFYPRRDVSIGAAVRGLDRLDILPPQIQFLADAFKVPASDFAAQGTKMRELYSDLAKACFKPIELTMPNMQGTK